MTDGDWLVCRTCGACCARFRILLSRNETSEVDPDGVPVEMTIPDGEFLRVMKGTEKSPIRCVALEGNVGTQVACRIYSRRCQMCREFSPLTEAGEENEACVEARAFYGLPPVKNDNTI